MQVHARGRHRRIDVVYCFIAVIFCLVLQGALSIWSSGPLSVSGDHIFLLSPARQMMEGQGFWGSDIVGYPYGQKNAYWPEFEPLLKLLLLLIAKLGFGLFTTIKVFYVVAIALMAIAAYGCLRKLGIEPHLACVGAIGFTVSGYFQIRGVNHDFLSVYISAAFGSTLTLLICFLEDEGDFYRLIASRFFIACVLIISTSGLYYALFSLLFMSLAMVAFSFRLGKAKPLAVFTCLASAMLVLLVFGALGPNIGMLASGAPKRAPWEQFRHGLSISDAIYSFNWIPGLPRVIMRYERERADTLIGEGHHEWPGALLSIVIIFAPLVALWAINNSAIDRRLRFVGPAAALITLGLVFSSRGGTGYLFNTLINPALRGQSRMMPFLIFMAIFIVMIVAQYFWLRNGRWHKIWVGLVMAGIVVSSAAVSGVLTDRIRWTSNDVETQALIHSYTKALAAKSKAGLTAVLQLPLASWPEYQMHSYGPIFDLRGSKTRWSFGTSERQPEFKDLKEKIMPDESADRLPSRARAAGFDGMFIEKRDVSEGLLAGLRAALTSACVLYEDDRRVLFDLAHAQECRA